MQQEILFPLLFAPQFISEHVLYEELFTMNLSRCLALLFPSIVTAWPWQITIFEDGDCRKSSRQVSCTCDSAVYYVLLICELSTMSKGMDNSNSLPGLVPHGRAISGSAIIHLMAMARSRATDQTQGLWLAL